MPTIIKKALLNKLTGEFGIVLCPPIVNYPIICTGDSPEIYPITSSMKELKEIYERDYPKTGDNESISEALERYNMIEVTITY